MTLVVLIALNGLSLYKSTMEGEQRQLDRVELQTLRADLDNRVTFGGQPIWRVAGLSALTSSQLGQIIPRNLEYAVILNLRKIDCLTCYGFHISHLKALVDSEGLSVSLTPPRYFDYVRKDLPMCRLLEGAETECEEDTTSDAEASSLNIFVIDDHGTIVLSETADKHNYPKSERFYQILKSLLRHSLVKDLAIGKNVVVGIHSQSHQGVADQSRSSLSLH